MTNQVTQSDGLDFLDALIYGDVFDCAVTLDELWRYARAPIDRERLRSLLREHPLLSRLIIEKNGYYCMVGRNQLLSDRATRIARAHRLQKRAKSLARVLRHLPFVRGLMLTGSTSADDATRGADIDLLVIVAHGRLGTVFGQLAPVASLLGGRVFCPNWYMSEEHLGMAPRNLYYARELAQARNLSGTADALHTTNPWIWEVFPNATPPPLVESNLKHSSRIQRFFEALLLGELGHHVEHIARRLVRSRLRAHYARFDLRVPENVSSDFESGRALGFHGYRYEARTLQTYADRRTRLKEELGMLSQGTEAAGLSL